ncbi:LOW QUALITY PROTEIN: hypothetical protein Dda_2506 [Drechslerella dactyloides]|uniref:Beta-catenin-like protein 1 N-terminal domain-containing protein n=1 Tax=Drechslerella dactyloides TaxID=74499 RepID=A0AAD6IZM9_DREDA|nr:LOW QUALITY PROTEIN: hypothetical protein Dda_2506 [Drechslerella dactyloides]
MRRVIHGCTVRVEVWRGDENQTPRHEVVTNMTSPTSSHQPATVASNYDHHKPAIPPTSKNLKRKLDPPVESPNDRYKATRLELNGKGKARATVEDAPDEDDDRDGAMDTSADGDDFAAEADEDIEDEEGGRFFGGGITQREKEILDFMDEEDEDPEPEKIDASYLRRLAVSFERKINKNAEHRAKFDDDPPKFMDSEADLDAEIKALAILAEHPTLYPEFVRLNCQSSLVSLLSHDNTDIVVAVIQLLGELTDDDVDATPEQWKELVDALLADGLLEILVGTLSRLREDEHDEDRAGVYHTLELLENLSSQQEIAEQLVSQTKLLPWLLQRIQKKESPVTQNKQYAAELLSILMQQSSVSRTALIAADGVDALLQLLSPYRKRDPGKGGEEEEMVENMFDTATCLVDERAGKEAFVEAEGVELCLIMLREGKMSKSRSLRLLDHACSGMHGSVVCERLVDAQGLKTLFGSFMKKQDAQTTEHLLGIFASLLRNLPADSPPRIRTLAKFVEKDYQKLAKILALRQDYARRMWAVNQEIRAEQAGLDAEELEDRQDEWDLRRLDAGLFCFQILDQIISWLAAEDDGARKHAADLLSKSRKSLEDVKKNLQDQLDELDDSKDEGKATKEMLTALISCL